MTRNNDPTIRILYFAGCPNHQPAVELVETVVHDLRIEAIIEEVELFDPEDAQRFAFLGSPTIQVNGIDIEPAARERSDYGFACRTYESGAGVPDRELLEAAIGQYNGASWTASCCSSDESQARFGVASGIGSAFSAILASSCCWVPLILIGLGVSSAGVSSFLWEWRPWLLASALGLLAAGVAWTIWRGKRCCGARERRALRLNRAVLLASTVMVGMSIFAPTMIDHVLVRGLGFSILPVATESGATQLRIDGMHCATCAVSVQKALSKVDGVERARVDYISILAQIEHAGHVSVSDLIEAIERDGYSARVVAGDNKDEKEHQAAQGDSS